MTLYHDDYDLGWLWGALHNEQAKLLAETDQTKSNDANRTYVRSLFSMIEGITYRTRQILLSRQKASKIELSVEQIIALSEISIEIESNGNLKTRAKHHDFKGILLFTLKLYCEKYGKIPIFQRFLLDKRYNDFKESILMRNRITHPKTPKDIYINGGDIVIVLSARDWIIEFFIEAFTGDLLYEEN